MSYKSSLQKDPVSMKLRVANMKAGEVQGRTRQLEEESRQMEDRLRELKLSMNREKELREQRGGGHWKSGKEGNLNSHAKDVLKKSPSKPNSSGKARKVKVLKDDPIISTPKGKEKPRPGTLAFLAQRDNSKPGLRPSGPICGQCDIKAAVVTCQECSEIYCSGCFTAFHLKGALAKHHSVPLSKIVASPRGSNNISSQPPSIGGTGSSRQPQSTEQTRIIWEQQQSVQRSSNQQQEDVEDEPGQDSLLDGEYDEKEAALSFQQALAEWRKENTDPKPSPAINSTRNVKQMSVRKPTQLGSKQPNVRVVSPVHTPRVNVDEGTSTMQGSTNPATNYQPEFKSSELSYAEKLLLKKNRRSTVPSLISSPAFQCNSADSAMAAEYGEVDGDILEEPISFERILATVQNPMQGDEQLISTADVVEIEELFDEEVNTAADDAGNYMVVEEAVECSTNVSDNQERVYPTVVPAPTALFHKSIAPHITQHVGGRESVSSSLQIVDVSYSMELDSMPPSSAVVGENQQTPPEDTNRSTSRKSRKAAGIPEAPADRKQRVGSSMGRPASGLARPKSRGNTSFHRSSRPRTAAEKAVDMFGSGTLTKQPSPALTDIISKYKTTGSTGYTSASYSEALGEFFTAGVKAQFTEKTLTPRKEKPQSPGQPLKKHQISNKVYSLSHKSWRPDSSLGGNVLDEQVSKFYEEIDASQLSEAVEEVSAETTISYSWSADHQSDRVSITDSITQSLSDRLSLPAHSSREPQRSTPLYNTGSTGYAPGSRGYVSESTRHSSGALRVSRAKTEYSVSSRRETTPRLCKTPLSVRSHTPIVVDGDDMTQYDCTVPLGAQEEEDLDAMNDLELELASETGRLTADGTVSRLVLEDAGGVEDAALPKRSLTPDTHRNIDRLRESIMDDFEEAELLIMQDEAMRVSLL